MQIKDSTEQGFAKPTRKGLRNRMKRLGRLYNSVGIRSNQLAGHQLSQFDYSFPGFIRGPGFGGTRCGTGLQSTVNEAFSEDFMPSGYTTSSLVQPW